MHDCKLPKDSVYARVLHRLGVLQYYTASELNRSIENTVQSIQINRSYKSGTSLSFLSNSYTNLGLYYKDLLFYREALNCFDSSVYFAAMFANQEYFILQSRLQRSNIFFQTGDYQKAVEESTLGIAIALHIKDSVFLASLFNERAQSLSKLSDFIKAQNDIDNAISLLKPMTGVEDILADTYKIQAALSDSTRNYKDALNFYRKAITQRKIYNEQGELAGDLIDAAIFIDTKMNNSREALNYYKMALKAANDGDDILMKTRTLNNIGALYKRQNILDSALKYYHKGLNTFVNGFTESSVNINPSEQQLKSIADKQMLFILLGNKAEALFLQHRQTGNKKLLQTSLATFYLTDKIIDEMRYSQNTEPTKLYWRNKTRNFYARAVTAAVAADDADAALFFIEKSRAVLLNDRLNELGAFAYLPAEEATQEQRLRIGMMKLQQQLYAMNNADSGYVQLQQQFFTARQNFEKFIESLEKKFPAYYQYKYGGINLSIQELRDYVKKQNATLVTFFETDSLVYAIKLSGTEKKIISIRFPKLHTTAADFLQLCSNSQQLNSNYNHYATLAHSLYNQLFAPLQVQTKRVILSADQVFLPFDAFTKDKEGKQFLLYDYVFSYAYSASYLMKTSVTAKSGGDHFLGVAPQHYTARLQLADLQGSVSSIKKIKEYYSSAVVLTDEHATRQSFLNNAHHYKMLHIYAHAIADSAGNEPQLYMQDSAISLSELQLMQNPAAQLIFLSACETNRGRQQRGEGVYSLARGFAAAGIPSTIATLWKADNEAMYSMSEVFHSLIKKGMDKDEALQQAKIAFIKNGAKENQLPFYWASLVLIGNTAPVQFSASPVLYIIIVVAGLLSIALVFFLRKQKKAAQGMRPS